LKFRLSKAARYVLPTPVCTEAAFIPALTKASVMLLECLIEQQNAIALLFPYNLKYFKTSSALFEQLCGEILQPVSS
jgi:hypothetical protein